MLTCFASSRVSTFLAASLAVLCALGTPALAQESDSAAASDLSVAGIRQALADERVSIAAHPKDPKNYVQLAYTLSDAGMGAAARRAAADAARVAPRSPFVFSAQGWILRHNDIGVDFGRGFDYDASLHSYQRAIELDPKDLDIRESLGNLLQHNRQGIDYGPGAQLTAAIDAYRYVKQHQSPATLETEDNLGLVLFFAGRYEEVLTELTDPANSPKHQGVILSALAATRGSAAAIERSKRLEMDEATRKEALTTAAEGLWDARMYDRAADLLTASLPNPAEEGIAEKIKLFRGLKPYRAQELPASDPRRPVQRLMTALVTDTMTDAVLSETVSRASYASDDAWHGGLEGQQQISNIFLTVMRQTGLPRVVVSDLIFSRMKIEAGRSFGPGTVVMARVFDAAALLFFVMPEKDGFRIVATGNSASEAGNQALSLLARQRPEDAAALLDWERSLQPSAGGDDPLGGSLFQHLWMAGGGNSPQTMTVAAASLVKDPAILKTLLPTLTAARENAGTEVAQAYLDLLLAHVYLRLQDAASARPIVERLLQRYPESIAAVRVAGRTYELTKDWPAWKAILAARLKSHPADRDLLLEDAAEAEAEGVYSRARAAYRTLIDAGSATAVDRNMDAWLSLFEGRADEQALAEAQEASHAEGEKGYAYLHTLACVNASRGATAEARQQLLDAMIRGYLEEPNGAIWLGFGLIYEQYGEEAAAAEAYRRVTRPATFNAEGISAEQERTSSYALAQIRLKGLGVD